MNYSGVYSLIQFSPEPRRNEWVNVGVVLVCTPRSVCVRMSSNNDYLRERFPACAFDDVRLASEKHAFANRLQGILPDKQALLEFRSQEAGRLMLTKPLSIVVDDDEPQLVCDKLFAELVGDDAGPREPLLDIGPEYAAQREQCRAAFARICASVAACHAERRWRGAPVDVKARVPS